MISVLCMAGLAVCVIAILATAVMSALGKKPKIPLVLYGLAVLLVLAAEFVLSNSETAQGKPSVSRTADIVAAQPLTPPSPAPLAQQDDTALDGDEGQEEILPPEEDAGEAAEPPEESQPAPAPAASTPPEPSGKKIEPQAEPAGVPAYHDATFTTPPDPEPAANTEPMLEVGSIPASDSGPVLAEDPVPAPLSNPTLAGDPEPDYAAGPMLPDSDSSSNK